MCKRCWLVDLSALTRSFIETNAVEVRGGANLRTRARSLSNRSYPERSRLDRCHHTRFFVKVAVLVVLVLAGILVPATSAASHEGTWFLEADWAVPCDASHDGSIKLYIDSSVPPGYVTVNTWDAKSALLGSVVSYTTRRTFPSGFYVSAPSFWPVFAGGWTKMSHSVYAPDGKLLTYAYVFADCLTGKIVVGTNDVYSGTL